MRFLSDIVMGLLVAGLVLLTIFAVVCTFAPGPEFDRAGTGTIAAGCIVALAILNHTDKVMAKRKEDTPDK